MPIPVLETHIGRTSSHQRAMAGTPVPPDRRNANASLREAIGTCDGHHHGCEDVGVRPRGPNQEGNNEEHEHGYHPNKHHHNNMQHCTNEHQGTSSHQYSCWRTQTGRDANRDLFNLDGTPGDLRARRSALLAWLNRLHDWRDAAEAAVLRFDAAVAYRERVLRAGAATDPGGYGDGLITERVGASLRAEIAAGRHEADQQDQVAQNVHRLAVEYEWWIGRYGRLLRDTHGGGDQREEPHMVYMAQR